MAFNVWESLGKLGDRMTPETVFLVVVGVFGLLCAAVTPPFQVPDEPIHWYRVYQLSLGHWNNVTEPETGRFVYGAQTPVGMLDCCEAFHYLQGNKAARVTVGQIRDEFKRPFDPNRTRFYAFPSTTRHSPMAYPVATGTMAIARVMRWPPVAMLYAGRAGTLIGYLLVGWLAVRVTPVLKWPAVMLLCSPTSVFLAASLSADAMTIAFSFLATGIVLRLESENRPLDWRRGTVLIAAMSAVAVCKTGYLPIVLLVAALPWAKLRAAKAVTAVAILLPVGLSVAWSVVTHPQHARESGYDPAGQMAWVRGHPVEYVEMFGRTIATRWDEFAVSAVGNVGWLDAPLPFGVVELFYVALLWLTWAYGEPEPTGLKSRTVFAAVAGACAGVVCFLLYLTWNHLGGATIDGIQGRYFLPISLICCVVIRRRNGYAARPGWVLVLLFGFGACLMMTLWRRYYA